MSRVVHALGGDTLALVLAGGVTGHFLAELLDDAGVPHRCLPIAGRTRVSTVVYDQSNGLEYRFVLQGPVIAATEWSSMLTALQDTDAHWVVASGSLAPGVPEDFGAREARLCAERGQRLGPDSSGAPLKAALG